MYIDTEILYNISINIYIFWYDVCVRASARAQCTPSCEPFSICSYFSDAWN